MIFDFNKFRNIDIYNINKNIKRNIFLENFKKLTFHHMKNCKEYKTIIKSFNFKKKDYLSLEEFPYLSARLFKSFKLKSVNTNKVFKTLKSSGTSGSQTSDIFLDKENALNQSKVLNKIITSVLGKKRLPMLIIDTDSILKDKTKISARTAAINGFSIFGYDHTFILNSNMELELKKLMDFIEKYKKEKIFIFGFTYIIWSFFCEILKKKNIKINLENCVLIHGGGWKKLYSKNINNEKLKNFLKDNFNISDIYNYYGMVEQAGSIFLECKCGYFHTSIFSDIIVRKSNLLPCKFGEQGIVQLLSLLPTSYPGHNILTDDIGVINGEDNCKCKKKGKYFKIIKRVDKSDLRGCSDTFEA